MLSNNKFVKTVFLVFGFALAFLITSSITLLAATNYGDGTFGGGNYDTGDAPTAIPTISTSSPATFSNTSSSGGSQCNDTVPSGLTLWLYEANANSSSSVTLRFINYQNPIDRFVLEYGLNTNSYQFGLDNIMGSSTNSLTVNHLSPDTKYYFRIRPGNGCATGTWSNELSVKTRGLVSLKNLNTTQFSVESTPPEIENPPTNCKTYIVKAGDTLWNIASSQLGNEKDYKNIMTENSDTYPSLKTSDSLKIGWKLKINCQSGINQPLESPTPPTGFRVSIKVTNSNQKPIVGANVTLRSTPKTAKTDNDGMTSFTDVEPGDHTIQIDYNNYHGEQSINLTGNVKEFNVNVTIESKNAFRAPQVLAVIGVFFLIITLLTYKLILKRK